jgi:hypothetical protein
MATPIRLKSHKVRIRAPRELVYQVMSSFGRGGLDWENGESSRVIQRSGDELTVEFKTRAGGLTITTIERVTLEAPGRIAFEHIKGPFQQAREEFVLSEVEGGMELEHRGEFVWFRLPVVGWLAGQLLIKRAFERVIEHHVERIKAASEARAERSHVFPGARSARSSP